MVIAFIIAKGLTNKLKREGVKSIEKYTISEYLSSYITYCIPFVNILIIVISLFIQDTIYEAAKEKILERNEKILNISIKK